MRGAPCRARGRASPHPSPLCDVLPGGQGVTKRHDGSARGHAPRPKYDRNHCNHDLLTSATAVAPRDAQLKKVGNGQKDSKRILPPPRARAPLRQPPFSLCVGRLFCFLLAICSRSAAAIRCGADAAVSQPQYPCCSSLLRLACGPTCPFSAAAPVARVPKAVAHVLLPAAPPCTSACSVVALNHDCPQSHDTSSPGRRGRSARRLPGRKTAGDNSTCRRPD